MPLRGSAAPFVLILLLSGCNPAVQKDHAAGLQAIRPDVIHKDLFVLAADAMRGRKTPSPELDSAAAYIARQFQLAGLQPLHGHFRQHIPLNVVSLGDSNSLSIETSGAKRSYILKSEFTPFEMTADRKATGELVFAGYGITAPELGYDDYAGIDARGKVVVVLRHEPGEKDPGSRFDGVRQTEYSGVAAKARIAKDHGAVGLLVVTDPLHHSSLAPRGFPWPSLTRTLPRDALPLTLGSEEASKLPVVHVGTEAIVQLFGSVETLIHMQQQIDSSYIPHSFVIAGAAASIRTSTVIRDTPADNVVGMVEGTDTLLKHQVVIVGAHYDHVGVLKGYTPGADSVFNGADDNASGTVAMLAVARALGDMSPAPKRTVVFIAFAGEEEGVLGSQYYVSRPLFPLDSTVAMLNLDMVGRNNADSLFIIGSDSSPDLSAINDEENRTVGFTLLYEVKETGGSDHISFRRKGIPVLFYHSGLHADYHRVTDNPDRINITKVTNVAKLVFKTAWHIANDNHRYLQLSKSTSIF